MPLECLGECALHRNGRQKGQPVVAQESREEEGKVGGGEGSQRRIVSEGLCKANTSSPLGD